MTVYVVLYCVPFQGDFIEKVFLDKEKANEYVEKRNKVSLPYSHLYIVETHEVDDD
jgi:hypothetical protein